MSVAQTDNSIHSTLGMLTAAVDRMEKAIERTDEKSSENRRRMYDQLRVIGEQTTRQTENITALTRITEKNSESIDNLSARLASLEQDRKAEKVVIEDLQGASKRFERYEQRAYGMKAVLAIFMTIFGSAVYALRDKIIKLIS